MKEAAATSLWIPLIIALIGATANLLAGMINARRLVRIERELDRAENEHQIKLSKLHEKRMNILEILYQYVCAIQDQLDTYVLLEGTCPADELGRRWQETRTLITKTVKEFRHYQKRNSIYLNEETVAKLLDFYIHASNLDTVQQPTTDRDIPLAVIEFQTYLGHIAADITTEFRSILGND